MPFQIIPDQRLFSRTAYNSKLLLAPGAHAKLGFISCFICPEFLFYRPCDLIGGTEAIVWQSEQ
jgi:hypothetical protein